MGPGQQGDGAGTSVEVSVVVACRDAEEDLAEQLRALAAQECGATWEVVLADNGSTDGTLAVAEAHRHLLPGLRILDASSARGPAGARNAGVRAARGDLIVFCDADDVVAPGWLAAMVDALREHPVVVARLDHDQLNHAWSRALRASQTGLVQSEPPFLPYAFCAALGVRRSAHEAVGGFREEFDRACEDRDYCYRLQLAGYPLSLADGAVVHYRHRESPLGVFRQSRSYGLGNVQIYAAYRAEGLGRPSQPQALASWLLTPVRFVQALRSRDRFAVFMARTGWRVGRLQGSLRFRVWCL